MNYQGFTPQGNEAGTYQQPQQPQTYHQLQPYQPQPQFQPTPFAAPSPLPPPPLPPPSQQPYNPYPGFAPAPQGYAPAPIQYQQPYQTQQPYQIQQAYHPPPPSQTYQPPPPLVQTYQPPPIAQTYQPPPAQIYEQPYPQPPQNLSQIPQIQSSYQTPSPPQSQSRLQLQEQATEQPAEIQRRVDGINKMLDELEQRIIQAEQDNSGQINILTPSERMQTWFKSTQATAERWQALDLRLMTLEFEHQTIAATSESHASVAFQATAPSQSPAATPTVPIQATSAPQIQPASPATPLQQPSSPVIFSIQPNPVRRQQQQQQRLSIPAGLGQSRWRPRAGNIGRRQHTSNQERFSVGNSFTAGPPASRDGPWTHRESVRSRYGLRHHNMGNLSGNRDISD